MSEISELDGPELYYALLNRRIQQWESAIGGSRAETEAAEAFTRAWAEMDAALSNGAPLPAAWEKARSYQQGSREEVR